MPSAAVVWLWVDTKNRTQLKFDIATSKERERERERERGREGGREGGRERGRERERERVS